jgi:hypothetical protein
MDVDTLRGLIARKHDVVLGKDDPIFLTVTLNELVLEEFLTRMKAIADDAQAQSIAATSYQVEVAKAAGGKLVTESAGYIANQVTQRVTVAVEAAIARADEAADTAARASNTALWAAVVTLLVIGPAIGLVIADLLRR